MNLDGLTIAVLAAELSRSVVGSRIQKIYHPRPGVVTLELWAGGEQLLLIETEENPRIHLTQQRLANPPQPSAFCMLLRKHLRNGVVVGVSQPGLERILDVVVRHGEEYILRAELLGKHANIILLRDGTIVGALKSAVGQRSFRPGEIYQAPPSQGKLDPRAAVSEEFFTRLAHEQGELAGALARILDGIGPRLAKEIAVRAQLSPSHSVDRLSAEQRAALWDAACHLFESALQHPSPHLYFDGDVPVDVAPIPLNLYEHLRGESRPTLSQALDELCSLPKQTVDQEKLALQKNVRHHLVKASLALERVTRDLENTQEYERLRHEGELLLAHLSQIPKGASAVELEDFLDGTKKTIALDPALSPLENAQRKFERAKKLKRAQQKLAARAQELRQEVEYLAGVESSLERAESPEDLAKLREELRARLRLERTSSPAIGRRRAHSPDEVWARVSHWGVSGLGRALQQGERRAGAPRLKRGLLAPCAGSPRRPRHCEKNPTQREVPPRRPRAGRPACGLLFQGAGCTEGPRQLYSCEVLAQRGSSWAGAHDARRGHAAGDPQRRLMPLMMVGEFVVALVAFFLAVVCHEYAHGRVAYALGIPRPAMPGA
jgi:predicted ribosome quality control (RQC) complex YloA/Tae2 family protein